MKNRKIVVVAFLLVATMLLGVGYAALTDELTITGEIVADPSFAQDEFEGDVFFSHAAAITQPASGHAEAHVTTDVDIASFGVTGLQQENQFAVFEFTIKNESTDFAALITPGVSTLTNDNPGHNADEIFDVQWSWTNDDWNSLVQGAASINMNNSKTLYVRVALKTTPTEAHEANFTLTFNVEQQTPATPPIAP